MTRQEEDHGAGEGNACAYGIADNSESPYQYNAQNQVGSAFDQNHPSQGPVLGHAPEGAARSSLGQHQCVRDQQHQQNRIASRDVLGAHPRLDHRLAQNDEYCANGKYDEGAGAVPGNKDFAQTGHVAGCL